MVQAKCLGKIRGKNNHIIGYRLVDKNKNEVAVKAEKLKEVIRSGQLEIINLTLTSDNRLVDKKPVTPLESTTTPSLKPNINVEAMIDKATAIGYNIKSFDTACGHKCYITSSPDNTKHFLLIPDDVKYIYEADVILAYSTEKKLYEYLSNIEGALKVVGGKNLISAQRMFYGCKARSIDLSSFNISNVIDMSWMFYECQAQSINLRTFNTSKVTDMRHMFRCCGVHSLDLSSFDTSRVTDMNGMFSFCEAYSIDLSSFNTSEVTDMNNMFNNCRVQSLDLSSFDTSNVTNMDHMFLDCEAQSLDLSSFDTRKVTGMRGMFYKCKAQSIDLSSFDISKVRIINGMFDRCEAQIKVNDAKLKEQLKSRR